MDDQGLYAAKIANYAFLGASVLHTLTLARVGQSNPAVAAYVGFADVERLRELERLLDSSQRGARPLIRVREAPVLPSGEVEPAQSPRLFSGYAMRDMRTYDLVKEIRSLANNRVGGVDRVDVDDPDSLLVWVTETRGLLRSLQNALTGTGQIDDHQWDAIQRSLVPFLDALADLEPAEPEFAQEWRELRL